MCDGSSQTETSSEFNQAFLPTESDPFPIESGQFDNEINNVRPSRRRRRNVSGRRLKRSSSLKDQQSTGRKRAAKLFPLFPERSCEWEGNSNCGGGSYPILGCLGGKQEARHHGPHKNTLDNEEGNVHRICNYCHNRWHVANDPSYNINDPDTTPHSPIPFTESERGQVALDMLRYAASKQAKVKIND